MPGTLELASPETDALRQQLSELFAPMMQTLHSKAGAQFNVEILAEDKVQDFIGAHAKVLDSAFERTAMSDRMRQRLQQSDYIFSGIKTFHELNEVFPSLVDESGNRKPFEQFLNDVRKIDETYNKNYLRAEYNFVQSSAEMAGKWEQIEQDGDRYNLQYRTAGDSKVRPEHAALNGVTLPPSDPFWQTYYPPNGWNCRCTVVQVRKTKYPATPHDEAMQRGAQATGKDTKGIFQFNAGMEQKTFPDYNPYTIKRCRDCDIAKGKLNLARPLDNELCDACKLVHMIERRRVNETVSRSRNREAQKNLTNWYKKSLPEVKLGKFTAKRLCVTDSEGVEIVFNKTFYNEVINKYQDDPLYPLKLEYARRAHEIIKQSRLTNPSEDSVDHPDSIFRVYEYDDDCYLIEMKVKCNADGNIMRYLRVYKK